MGNKPAVSTSAADDKRVVRPPGPCQALACDIQTCLAKNDYQEARCQSEMNAFQQCMLEHKLHQQGQQEEK